MEELHVGIRDLKSNLCAYLRKVKAGQAITITDHGKKVGRILPVDTDLDKQIDNLQKAGLISWNHKKLGSLTSQLINQSDRMASDLFVEMRE
jgi:prevent-host-death family protein